MKRKAFTLAVMAFMIFVGVIYWYDLSSFINPVTGFADRFPLWPRYLLAIVAAGLAVVGLRGVSPYAIGLLRIRNIKLALLFGLAGIAGIVYGEHSAVESIILYIGVKNNTTVAQLQGVEIYYQIILGLSYIWYGVWMILAAKQLAEQTKPSPTKSAVGGMLAALPFCLQTVYRAIVNPNSIYRLANLINILAALFTMLWFGMLLRALYIALVQRRVRWMYFFGLITFLLSTCLQGTQYIYQLVTQGFSWGVFLQAFNVIMVGLVTGGASLEIAGREELKPQKIVVRLKNYPKDPFSFY